MRLSARSCGMGSRRSAVLELYSQLRPAQLKAVRDVRMSLVSQAFRLQSLVATRGLSETARIKLTNMTHDNLTRMLGVSRRVLWLTR
ncbi:MAG: hypothetical protein RL701_292 [Pseudomonadota bacterium]